MQVITNEQEHLSFIVKMLGYRIMPKFRFRKPSGQLFSTLDLADMLPADGAEVPRLLRKKGVTLGPDIPWSYLITCIEQMDKAYGPGHAVIGTIFTEDMYAVDMKNLKVHEPAPPSDGMCALNYSTIPGFIGLCRRPFDLTIP